MAMVKAQIPEGYATIRRSKSRAKKLRCTSTSSNETQQFEMIDMVDVREKNANNRKYDSDILYNNHQNDIYDAVEVDEGVINDIDQDGDVYAQKESLDYYGDNKKRTFETFKPKGSQNSVANSNNDISISQKDLRHFDLLMSPLKSPQYINQLNAMRNNNNFLDNSTAVRQQFPLYARPDSPKYGKFFNNNRSTSPSADSMDNCSSNSSTTYSPAYRNNIIVNMNNQQQMQRQQSHDDDNLILIDNRKTLPPMKGSSSLGYRKSFSHINRSHHHQQHFNGGSGVESNNNNNIHINRKHNGFMKPFTEANSQEYINYEKPSISTLTMPPPLPKSLGVPSISTSNLYTRRRFATLAHPKEKLLHGANTKSTSSLNESHVYWDPVLDSKIGSQTTLRAKPAIPWWEIACKKEYRQSCPPMQVNIYSFFLLYFFFFFRYLMIYF